MPMIEKQLSVLYRGDTRYITLTVQDGNAAPIDITNDTITLTVAENRQGTPVIQIINTVGDHEDPVNGVTIFKLDSADTLLLTDRKLHPIDIIREEPSGDLSTLFIGYLPVENRVMVST